MELVLALQEASQIRVTCDDHYSHSADLHPLLTENASRILDDPATYGKKLYAALSPPPSIAQQALATMPERLLIVTSEPLLDGKTPLSGGRAQGSLTKTDATLLGFGFGFARIKQQFGRRTTSSLRNEQGRWGNFITQQFKNAPLVIR